MIVRTLAAAAAVLIAGALGGCYSSSYNAVGFVHSNTPGEAYMSFHSFEGRMVIRLTTEDEAPGRLNYSGSLGEGSANVYYDFSGQKQLLFSIKEGEQTESTLELPQDTSGYVIVETNGECLDGELNFSTEAD